MKALCYIMTVVAVLLVGCGRADHSATKSKPVRKLAPAEITPEIMAVKKEVKKAAVQQEGASAGDQLVDFSPILGRVLGDLYIPLTGLKGVVEAGNCGKGRACIVVPPSATVNYGKTLADMWVKKLDRRKGVSYATIDNSHTPIALYIENPNRMNLKQLVNEANAEIEIVKRNINWAGLCKKYKLVSDDCQVLKSIVLSVTGTDLVAYGMTELLPSADGVLNVAVMDLVLRNAGANYIMAFPALYDQYLSLGLYQFTSLALRHDAEAVNGASIANRYLPEAQQIPGSVIMLRGSMNHRAAYLFVIHNFAELVKKTNAKEIAALKYVSARYHGDMVTFMACAHHAPGLAIRSMKIWLGKGGKGAFNPNLVGRLKAYGKKTDNNLSALHSYVSARK